MAVITVRPIDGVWKITDLELSVSSSSEDGTKRGVRSFRLGLWYVVGALALANVAMWLAPWGLLLLWPCVSLALVAAAYLGGGPKVYDKHHGRLSTRSRLLLGPVLASQWLWRQKDWRRTGACDQIMPGLRIGRALTAEEARAQIDDGVTAVLDLTCEHDEAASFRELEHYRNIQILDLVPPSADELDEAVRFILDHRRGGEVLVHCAIGQRRSAVVAAAAVAAAEPKLTVDEVCEHIQSMRSAVLLPKDARAQVERYRRWAPGVKSE